MSFASNDLLETPKVVFSVYRHVRASCDTIKHVHTHNMRGELARGTSVVTNVYVVKDRSAKRKQKTHNWMDLVLKQKPQEEKTKKPQNCWIQVTSQEQIT